MIPQKIVDCFKIIKYEKKETEEYEAWYVKIKLSISNYPLCKDLLNNIPEWANDILYKDKLSPSAYHLLLRKKKYILENKPKILSFGFMNDLEFDFRKDYPYESEDEIPSLLEKIKEEVKEDENSPYLKAFFNGSIFYSRLPVNLKEIAEDLKRDRYIVYNYYDKYYVIALALEYTRFYVESEGCGRGLIKWRKEDENDPVINNL